MKVFLFPVKNYPFEIFARATPGSSLVVYKQGLPLGKTGLGKIRGRTWLHLLKKLGGLGGLVDNQKILS